VKDNEIRIGVYVCHCGKNIAGVIDTPSAVDYAQTLENVVMAREDPYLCAEPGQKQIMMDIREHNLNRVVIAACSPKLHEPTFRKTLANAGLNPYLLEMANIREHCSWVHHLFKDEATEKVYDLIRMAVAKARLLEPLENRKVPTHKRALVIGGGVAGMQAALDLADMDIPVILVEKEPFLGGKLKNWGRIHPSMEHAESIVLPMGTRVLTHPLISVFTQSEVTDFTGYIGNFEATIEQQPRRVLPACDLCGKCVVACSVEGENGRKAIGVPSPGINPSIMAIDFDLCTRCGKCVEVCPKDAIRLEEKETIQTFNVGAAVAAVGFELFPAGSQPKYGYGTSPAVVTSEELEAFLKSPQGDNPLRHPETGREIRQIAFIQCVGSRDPEGNRYCSRICCMVALKQVKELLDQDPNLSITVYYRDIRTIKKQDEDLYREVRNRGVRFIRGVVQSVTGNGSTATVKAFSETLDAMVEETVDLAVLSLGSVPPANRDRIKSVLKLSTSDDGFFLEAHPKLKPLDTAIDGVFLAGACQAPKNAAESIAQGSGAAARVAGLLTKDHLELDGIVAFVDLDKCHGECLLCMKQCPFSAIEPIIVDGKKKPHIIEAACKGCGTCAGACPHEAMQVKSFTREQLYAQIDAALENDPGHKILAFCCNWCSYAGADFAGVSRLSYPTNVRIIKYMCSGRVNRQLVTHAFEKGAGMVLISGCRPPGDCHYISGNIQCERRMRAIRNIITKRGIHPDRLRLEWVSATEGVVFQRVVTEMNERLKELEEETGE
jgi:heterodisulfide reductase subunit A